MKRLGIVVALSREIEALTGNHLNPGQTTTVSGEIVATLSGIGPQRASIAGRMLLDSGADALLSWGTAAALGSELSTGSVILPSKVIAADGTTYAVDQPWHQCLHRRLAERFATYTEPLVETAAVLGNPVDKTGLRRRCRACAVDMGSASLARLATEAKVPFLVLRVIADTADMGIPQWVLPHIDCVGRPRISSLLSQLVSHPWSWPSLIKLSSAFRGAQERLYEVAQHRLLPEP